MCVAKVSCKDILDGWLAAHTVTINTTQNTRHIHIVNAFAIYIYIYTCIHDYMILYAHTRTQQSLGSTYPALRPILIEWPGIEWPRTLGDSSLSCAHTLEGQILWIYMHTHKYLIQYTYVYLYICTHKHTHIYIYIYICVYVCVSCCKN